MKGRFGAQGRIPIKSNEEISLSFSLPSLHSADLGLSTNFTGDFKIMASGRPIHRPCIVPFQNWNVHHKCLNGPKTSLYLVRTYKYWAFASARPLSYISPSTGWYCTRSWAAYAKLISSEIIALWYRETHPFCATGGERTGRDWRRGRCGTLGARKLGFIKVPCTLDAPLLLCCRFNGENLPRKSINFAVTNQTSQISVWSARVELAPYWFYEPSLIVSSGVRGYSYCFFSSSSSFSTRCECKFVVYIIYVQFWKKVQQCFERVFV